MVLGMNMGFNPGGPMYGMNNNNSQRRPTPYPNPMYMQAKRLQQPASAFPASSSGMVNSFDYHLNLLKFCYFENSHDCFSHYMSMCPTKLAICILFYSLV